MRNQTDSLEWAEMAIDFLYRGVVAFDLAGEEAGGRVGRLVLQARTVDASGEGLYFLPYLLGERSPLWDPLARGAFVGLSRHHGPAHLTKAVLEGVAFNLAICVDAFRAGAPTLQTDKGQFWAAGRQGYTLFNTVATPNDSRLLRGITCRIGCSGCGSDSSNFIPASSLHSGGINVLLADGSVRFIKDSISRQTWWALGTKAGGETISSDSY